jgi:NAD(P)-dependent dehydrogenase (short-subunit alcohol dehydrogenase family)
MGSRDQRPREEDMDIRALIDGGLELTIVGSFSRIGYAVRRSVDHWAPPRRDALAGRTVLVTGPTSGLGRETADELAALGARLLLVGRSEARLGAVRDDLVRIHGEDRFPVVVADMASLDSVRAAVAQILERESRLDVLVDNAGAIFPERQETPDGLEGTFATMVVGPFVLTAGLLPLLRRTGDSRVIGVTSGGMYAQRLDLDDLQSTREPFSGTRAYARAKRAQVALIREWARRLGEPGRAGIALNAMHPGWADTPGVKEALPGFYRIMGPLLRTPAEGADTLVWLATSPEAAMVSGKLFLDRRPRPFDRAPVTRLSAAERRRLWEIVVGLAGGPDPAPDGSAEGVHRS